MVFLLLLFKAVKQLTYYAHLVHMENVITLCVDKNCPLVVYCNNYMKF